MSEKELPKGWRWAKLGDVAEINPRRQPIERTDDALTSFIPMDAVDEVGGVAHPIARAFGEIKRGYTAFRSGDVLFAKITPCMENGKQAIAADLIDEIGFGTTEFHVVRAGPEVTNNWIHRYLRRASTRRSAAEAFTGAVGQQRVPPEFLRSLLIPVPPLAEQFHIIDRLDLAMADIGTTRVALVRQRDLIASLVDVQRDALLDEAGGEEVAIGEVCELDGSLVDPRLPAFSNLPCVSAEHIEANTGRLLEVPSAAAQEMISGKYRFDEGAVLYSKLRPYLRKVVIAPWSGLCSADMYPLRARGNILPQYLQAVLIGSGFSEYARELSRRARMPKLNREQLAAYRFRLPSLAEQDRVLARASEQAAGRQDVAAALDRQAAALDALAPSLLTAAFQGKL